MTAAITGTTARPLVRLVDVSRSFGATRAVRDVTMDIATPGTIHALVGENGAGKSTCLGMAAGRIAPTSGTILVENTPLRPGSPRASQAAGIHAIYQELTVIPGLSPAANVFLGHTLSRGGWLRERQMRTVYEELCDRLGVAPTGGRRSGDLSVADQQIIEILRAFISHARAILLDEPTASLAHAERESLYATMGQLRSQGLALALVSHNLDEVLEHSDDITVFKDGAVIETRPAASWSKRELVGAMLGTRTRGSEVAAGIHRDTPAARVQVATAAPVLTVERLSSPGLIDDVSFTLRPGEILGIAGLVGSGRTSLLRALAGLDSAATGSVVVGGARGRNAPRTVREARRRGIALLPEDRKGQGLLLSRSGSDNITLGEWRGLSKGLMLSPSRIEAASAEAARPVGFDIARLGESAARLSGGNQQKLMIARWLHTSHKVLLADEPTRGVDVGAKAEILVALEQIVAQGRSMIVVSSELEEVIGLSDRVLVIDKGSLIGTFDASTDDITVASLLQLIFRSSEQIPAARS